MTSATPRGPEEPLDRRARLSVPSEPEKSTRFANLSLGLDAAFCNIVGLVFTLTGAFMSDWLGVAGWILTVFGVAVLLWSFVVTLFANRRVSRRREISFVIKANLAFIVAAALWLTLSDMTRAGNVMVLAAIAVVAGFTLAQFLARRTLT